MPDTADHLVEQLAIRLRQPLPGRVAQERFAPELCYGRHCGPALCNARLAAVIAVLHRKQDQWHVVMTLRPQHLPDHAGQVCFPGGTTETGESSEQTALRELHEELGVSSDCITLTGQLTPVYVFATNFWVTPLVGVAKEVLTFVPDVGEVAEVVDVPVRELLNESNYGRHRISRRGVVFDSPHIQHGRHRIWGATCMMLGELIAILEEL